MRLTTWRELSRRIRLLLGGSVAAAVVVAGAIVQVKIHQKTVDRHWLSEDVLPFGGVVLEPKWSLELTDAIDNPGSLALLVERLRRRDAKLVEVLEERFGLVYASGGAHFEAPLMTSPEDPEGARALALLAKTAVEASDDAVREAVGRDLASAGR